MRPKRVEFNSKRQRPSDFFHASNHTRKIKRVRRPNRSRSQHFQDVLPEIMECLFLCAFCVSSLSTQSAGRSTRLAVEQTGLCPIICTYPPKYLVNWPGRASKPFRTERQVLMLVIPSRRCRSNAWEPQIFSTKLLWEMSPANYKK